MERITTPRDARRMDARYRREPLITRLLNSAAQRLGFDGCDTTTYIEVAAVVTGLFVLVYGLFALIAAVA